MEQISRDEQLFAVEYGYWFNLNNERFYRRIDVLINFVQLVGGSSAAFGAIQNSQAFVVASGIALAVCAALALLVQPAIKSECHRIHKAKFRELHGRSQRLNDEELIVAVSDLQSSGPAGIGALALPSFNDAARAIGRDHGCIPLSTVERISAAIA